MAEGKPSPNATKLWLTSAGACILANNNSKIPGYKLNEIMDVVSTWFFYICCRWKEHFDTDEICFYC